MTTQPSGAKKPPETYSAAPRSYPVLSIRAITWAAVALIMVGAGLATTLLLAFGDGRHPDQLEAIKTAGTIVLGTGGAAALWLAARRQRTAEISLNEQREANKATKHDATERRLTELYVKAVEQLGSPQAAVRHGGSTP